jgi:hypothetical protein
MFAVPPGWRMTSTADGIVLTANHPGHIVVDEDLQLTGRILDVIGSLESQIIIANVERLVTIEGEYAAIARGRTETEAYCLGFVFFDDSYMRVTGASPNAHADAVAAAVREIVITTRAWLGNPRRRRFLYDAPTGWRRFVTTSGDETWRSPTAGITVPRALPIASRAQMSIAATLLALELPADAPPADSVTTRHGLAGHRWLRTIPLGGDEVDVVVVALTDERYDYFVRLIAPHGAQAERSVLDALVDSIEPLPTTSAVAAAPAVAFLIS